MSGLFGFVGEKPTSLSVLNEMRRAIHHRGADDECFFYGSGGRLKLISEESESNRNLDINFGLGYCLRNADAERGAFFHDPKTGVSVLLDGAVFNHHDLKMELAAAGCFAASDSDSEVIGRGYERYGIDFIDRINGMFAIMISDYHSQKLYLVRDHFGIKPLFYSQQPNDLVFASEMKGILQHPRVRAQVFETGLIANYYLQATPGPYTCFRDIFSVNPGSFLEIDLATRSARRTRYWQISSGIGDPGNDIVQLLSNRIEESVRLRLSTTGRAVSLMSGGIDSTTITAMAHKFHPSIECYSFGLDGSGVKFDELPQAVSVAKFLGIRQIVQLLQPDDVLAGLDNKLRHFEAPYSSFETTILPPEYLSPMGYQTMLSGTAADGIFGGNSYLLKVRAWKLRRNLRYLRRVILPANDFLNRVRNALQMNTTFEYYANNRLGMRRYQILALMPHVKPETFDEILDWLANDISGLPGTSDWQTFFALELRHSIAAHYLFREDLSAMRSGMDVRYPFLDRPLVELVASLPVELRYSPVETKPLLRQVAAQYIPPISLRMPKRGFDLPILPIWRANKDFRNYMESRLSDLKQRGIYNNQIIDQWSENIRREFDLAKIWQLVTTETWLSEYVDVH